MPDLAADWRRHRQALRSTLLALVLCAAAALAAGAPKEGR